MKCKKPQIVKQYRLPSKSEEFGLGTATAVHALLSDYYDWWRNPTIILLQVPIPYIGLMFRHYSGPVVEAVELDNGVFKTVDGTPIDSTQGVFFLRWAYERTS